MEEREVAECTEAAPLVDAPTYEKADPKCNCRVNHRDAFGQRKFPHEGNFSNVGRKLAQGLLSYIAGASRAEGGRPRGGEGRQIRASGNAAGSALKLVLMAPIRNPRFVWTSRRILPAGFRLDPSSCESA